MFREEYGSETNICGSGYWGVLYSVSQKDMEQLVGHSLARDYTTLVGLTIAQLVEQFTTDE